MVVWRVLSGREQQMDPILLDGESALLHSLVRSSALPQAYGMIPESGPQREFRVGQTNPIPGGSGSFVGRRARKEDEGRGSTEEPPPDNS
jgi:hypothetical protein